MNSSQASCYALHITASLFRHVRADIFLKDCFKWGREILNKKKYRENEQERTVLDTSSNLILLPLKVQCVLFWFLDEGNGVILISGSVLMGV